MRSYSLDKERREKERRGSGRGSGRVKECEKRQDNVPFSPLQKALLFGLRDAFVEHEWGIPESYAGV
jgi:hypothetical protein